MKTQLTYNEFWSAFEAAPDNFNGDALITRTLGGDTQPPTVIGTPERLVDNSNGWYNHQLTVTWTGNDGSGGSGIASCDPATLYSSPDSASASVTGHCTDNANNIGTGTFAFRYDSTPPNVSHTVTPSSPNANGWYNGDVTVQFNAADAASGISGAGTQTFTLNTEGSSQSVAATFTDNAGNSNTDKAEGISIDKTPPGISGTATPAPNANGWRNTDVTVHFAASDSLSGLATVTPDAAVSTEGANQSVKGTSADKAGNSADYTVSAISIDKTPPVITSSSVGNLADNAQYYFGSVPSASGISCSASDALSGLDASGCVVSGYNTLVGPHTLMATARDKAGNQVAKTLATYTVLSLKIAGFFDPVDMSGTVNTIKSGQSVPLKFQVLAGTIQKTDPVIGSGTTIKSFTQQKVDCGLLSANLTDAVEITNTDSTSLRYDTTSAQFIGNWRTPSNSANTCWSASVSTMDGSSISAVFKLTK